VGVVAGIDVAVGVTVPGAGVTVPGVVVLVISVPVPVLIPGVPPVDVDMGVPATGERVGVCVSPGHVFEPTWGERTTPVPAMAAMSISDEV